MEPVLILGFGSLWACGRRSLYGSGTWLLYRWTLPFDFSIYQPRRGGRPSGPGGQLGCYPGIYHHDVDRIEVSGFVSRHSNQFSSTTQFGSKFGRMVNNALWRLSMSYRPHTAFIVIRFANGHISLCLRIMRLAFILVCNLQCRHYCP